LGIEVFASFLRDRQAPANAEAEPAIADLFEQTEREADQGLHMFYSLLAVVNGPGKGGWPRLARWATVTRAVAVAEAR
jgi:hypothetical protein